METYQIFIISTFTSSSLPFTNSQIKRNHLLILIFLIFFYLQFFFYYFFFKSPTTLYFFLINLTKLLSSILPTFINKIFSILFFSNFSNFFYLQFFFFCYFFFKLQINNFLSLLHQYTTYFNFIPLSFSAISFPNHKPTNRMLLPSLYYFLSYLHTILLIHKEKLPYSSLLFYPQFFFLTSSIYSPLFLSVIFPSISARKSIHRIPMKIKFYERKKNRASRVLLPGSFTIFVCDYVSTVIYPSVPSLSLARATTILIFVAFR